jgi:hypothetical protein
LSPELPAGKGGLEEVCLEFRTFGDKLDRLDSKFLPCQIHDAAFRPKSEIAICCEARARSLDERVWGFEKGGRTREDLTQDLAHQIRVRKTTLERIWHPNGG